MIIDYNRDPTITPEEQIKSLRDNVQLALDEQQMLLDNLSKSLLESLGIDITNRQTTSFAEQMQENTDALTDAIEDLVARVTALEQQEGE